MNKCSVRINDNEFHLTIDDKPFWAFWVALAFCQLGMANICFYRNKKVRLEVLCPVIGQCLVNKSTDIFEYEFLYLDI